LSKNLREAETTLRRAAARPPVDPRVRQNLALVVGLQGRFAEAETIARAELPPEEAAANVRYLRQMLARRHEPRIAARSHSVADPDAGVAAFAGTDEAISGLPRSGN
jgi:Flp pilus assembly protein TadD